MNYIGKIVNTGKMWKSWKIGFYRYFRFDLYYNIAHSILSPFLYHQVKFRNKIIPIAYVEGPFPVLISDRKSRIWRCIISGSTLYTPKISSQSVHGCPRSWKYHLKWTPSYNFGRLPQNCPISLTELVRPPLLIWFTSLVTEIAEFWGSLPELPQRATILR